MRVKGEVRGDVRCLFLIISKMRPYIRFIETVILCAMATGCQSSKDVEKTREPVPIVLTKAQCQVRDMVNGFSVNAFKGLAEERQKGEDLVFSPLSLSTALTMAAEGANGETLEQFASVLGWGNADKSDVSGYYKVMCRGLKEVDPSVHFDSSNSMWIQNNYPVQSAFKGTLSDYYLADVFEKDFSSSATVNDINKWVSDKTAGLIDKMVESLSENDKVLLINALVFKGGWTFEAEKAGEDVFGGENGNVKKEYFNVTTEVSYAETEDFQLFSMPYGNESYYMGVVLPSEGKSVNDIAASLSVEKLNFSDVREADIHFPMFTSSWRSENKHIISVLEKMGLTLPFSASADFSGIHDGLMITDIIQEAKIDVTDKGTVFAAATEVNYGDGAPLPPEKVTINVNRPFVYFIRENTSRTLLLMGIQSK